MVAAKKTLVERAAEKQVGSTKANGGFFDSYVDEGGSGMYLSEAEKELLLDEETTFAILGVRGPDNDGFNGKSRFVLTVEIEGEPRLMGFDHGTVFGRDRMLLAMQDYLATEGAEPPLVVLTKPKRAWILRDASAPAAEEES